MARPIQLRTHRVRIKAPRELVFQLMTAFGGGRLQGSDDQASRVLVRDGNDLVAEFKTKAGPFTYTTIEQVALEPPRCISFDTLKGSLNCTREEFVLNEVDGETELVHNGEFIWHRIPVIGWLGGWMYARPMFSRVIRKHMEQIKASAEARAARSHVFRKPAPEST